MFELSCDRTVEQLHLRESISQRLYMKKTSLLVSACLFLITSLPAHAGRITNNFNDLNNAVVDGLVDQGVRFSFSVGGVPSPAALYGVNFPTDSLIGSTVVSGPAGTTNQPFYGVLGMTFADPTNYLSFNIALDTDLNDLFKLDLFDENLQAELPVSIATIGDPNCDPSVSNCFSEARYVYSGGGLIGKAELNFQSTTADTFALSTLTYDTSIPEPGSGWSAAGRGSRFASRRAMALPGEPASQ